MSGSEPTPETTAVPTGLRARLSPRGGAERVRESLPAIAQITIAATVAFAFAHYLLGHPVPLLAATVTISSLGLVRDARPLRVLETVVGMIVGILIAELIVLVAGIGWWQLGSRSRRPSSSRGSSPSSPRSRSPRRSSRRSSW